MSTEDTVLDLLRHVMQLALEFVPVARLQDMLTEEAAKRDEAIADADEAAKLAAK